MKKLYKIAFNVFLLLILAAVWHAEAQAANDGRVRIGITIYADWDRNGLMEEDAQLMTNMLTDELAGTRNIRLYERRELESALKELRRGGSLAMDQNTVMRLGKIAGLQYVLIGSVDALGGKNEDIHVRGRDLKRKNDLDRVTLDHNTVAEKYAVNVRMIDVATGEIRLSVTEEKTAKAQSIRIPIITKRETVGPGDLRRQAIKSAMTSLTKKIRDSLTREFAFSSNLSPVVELPTPQKQIATNVSQPVQQPVQSQKGDFDPNVSNQAKVIQTYSIDSGQRNLLTVGHNAAYQQYRKGDFKAAYEAFNRLVDQYSGNYLAAYWAGESASKRGNRYKSDALECYNRALEINPYYVPAQNAKKRL